jgi:EamA domain-containing membrane protein RarD
MLVLPATLNKETFIFFLPSLYPLLAERLRRGHAIATIVAAIAIAGAVNIWDRMGFPHAGPYGVTAGFQWPTYLEASTYGTLEVTYGMRGPGALFLGTCLAVLVMVLRGWPFCPRSIRRHLAIMAAINVPLVLVTGSASELRNLSFLFVGLMVLGALGVDRSRLAGRSGPVPAVPAYAG